MQFAAEQAARLQVLTLDSQVECSLTSLSFFVSLTDCSVQDIPVAPRRITEGAPPVDHSATCAKIYNEVRICCRALCTSTCFSHRAHVHGLTLAHIHRRVYHPVACRGLSAPSLSLPWLGGSDDGHSSRGGGGGGVDGASSTCGSSGGENVRATLSVCLEADGGTDFAGLNHTTILLRARCTIQNCRHYALSRQDHNTPTTM